MKLYNWYNFHGYKQKQTNKKKIKNNNIKITLEKKLVNICLQSSFYN